MGRDGSSEVWRSMVCATSAVRHVLKRHLQDCQLTLAQFGVIRVVGEAGPHGIKLSDIGEKLFVSSGNVTGLVDRLEELRYVVRDTHPEDRRALLARLTVEGRRLYSEIAPEHWACLRAIMSCLTRKEQATLRELLDRICSQAEQELSETEAPASRTGVG